MTSTSVGDGVLGDADEPGSRAEPSDAELLARVRAGNRDAYGILWARHAGPARAFARQLTSTSNAEDLVSEVFARILRLLNSGAGPDGAFRPYLLSAIRRLNTDNGLRYQNRVQLTGDDSDFERKGQAPGADDQVLTGHENAAALRAWDSLPDAQRTLLWHLLIEEDTPAQVAPLLGISPNGVSVRAVRAKDRLRQAFLQQYLAETESEECRAVRRRLGQYVRQALSERRRQEIDRHLVDCAGCQQALLELRDINRTMRLVIAPLILGGTIAAQHYLTAAHHRSAPTHSGATSSVAHSATRVVRPWHLGALAGTAAAAAGVLAVVVGLNSSHPTSTSVAAPPAVIAVPSNPGASAPAVGVPSVTPTPVAAVTVPAIAVARQPNHSTPRLPAVAAASSPTTPARTVVTPTSPTPAPDGERQIVADAFQRTVGSGWGSADLGGAYNIVTPSATSDVANGEGVVGAIAPAESFQAILTSAQALNTRAQGSVRLDNLPATGGGLYFDLALRAHADGTTYYAKARIDPTGTVWLSLSRWEVNGTETILTPETAIAQTLLPGEELTVSAEVSGTSAVSLGVQAAVGSAPASGWTVSTVDSSASAITTAGAVGVNLYVSASSPAMSANVTALQAWREP